MPWTTLGFGIHRDKTLPQVILDDPDWFFWAMDKELFAERSKILAEAKDLARKACSIKLPSSLDGCVLEYTIHPGVMKLSNVWPVRETDPLHEGSSPTTRLKVLDLSFAHRRCGYDETGSKVLLRALKFMYFGKSEHLTKAKCEEFFENGENFVL